MAAAVGLIYFFGMAQYIIVKEVGLTTAFLKAIAPFIFADIVKAVMASFFTSAVLPKDR